MIRNTALSAALLALTLGSTACNTVKGLGRDIESVGEAGEEVISQAPGETADVQDAGMP